MESFCFEKLVALEKRRRPKKPTDFLELLFLKNKTWNVKPDLFLFLRKRFRPRKSLKIAGTVML